MADIVVGGIVGGFSFGVISGVANNQISKELGSAKAVPIMSKSAGATLSTQPTAAIKTGEGQIFSQTNTLKPSGPGTIAKPSGIVPGPVANIDYGYQIAMSDFYKGIARSYPPIFTTRSLTPS